MKHADLRRIGVIVPGGNMTLEWEFPPHLPPGFTANWSRVSRPNWGTVNKDSLLAMNDLAVRGGTDLVRLKPEAILYACTSGSFVEGAGKEADIAARISQATGIPALTTSMAVLEALRHLQARSVFMVTPYPDDINELEAEWLRVNGFDVIGYDSFRCDEKRPIASIASEEVAALVLRHRDSATQADAVFISCTNLLTFDQIDRLERELDRPVVSSNLASLWAVLKAIDAPVEGAGTGRLFTTGASQPHGAVRSLQTS